MKFFADKNVNVVIPQGIGSYYTDWIARDPVIGKPMWKTFPDHQTARAVDGSLRTSGVNVIGGMSMSYLVLNLAIAEPSCTRRRRLQRLRADQHPRRLFGHPRHRPIHRQQGQRRQHVGPFGSPLWTKYDPYINAAKLRGQTLYLSSGNGMAGKLRQAGTASAGAPSLGEQVVVGGRWRPRHTPAPRRWPRGSGRCGSWHRPPVGQRHPFVGLLAGQLHRSWPTLDAALRR